MPEFYSFPGGKQFDTSNSPNVRASADVRNPSRCYIDIVCLSGVCLWAQFSGTDRGYLRFPCASDSPLGCIKVLSASVQACTAGSECMYLLSG